ncbi:carbohydrate kinase [Spiractinospora alimapuensis]|uniref:FGGY-family carbohydrate kinase n=1 Tax=Spiractinospora alimapuensis TaxID=2820884 RepID=UPI001EFF1EED|nr:FGGY family carbohydrate kinase [Spiractinospora alimapuensis]QVQ51751.1 carbohydrate kinase [Spiractinospora alimapuensis]
MVQRRGAQRGWLGIDLGTQSVRAVLVDDEGVILGSASVPLESSRPAEGRHEQDPERWWAAVAEACQSAMAEAGPAEVGGLACCATSGTILLTEPTGEDPVRPLTPALMYDDARAQEQGERVRAAIVPAWREAGLTPQRTWALPKALWLMEHERPPRHARLTHQADLINSRFLGRPAATDTSHALKSGADPARGTWPTDDLTRLGLAPELLPPLVWPGATLGEVSARAARATGVPSGTPVVAGMTDGCAAQIAAGVLDVGRWQFSVGTTLVLKGASTALLRDPTGALYSHRGPDGAWWPGGASSAGTVPINKEFSPESFDAFTRAAAKHEPSPQVAYPLGGLGERFPFHNPDAHAIALGVANSDGERFAALLQGVAFVERLCLDLVTTLGATVDGPVTLTGGATRSTYWTQLQADILGRGVVVPGIAQGAVGMAILAAYARGDRPSATSAPSPPPPEAASGPRPQNAFGGDLAGTGDLAGVAKRMLGPTRSYDPRPGGTQRFAEPYARLVGELRRREWIGTELERTALEGLGE